MNVFLQYLTKTPKIPLVLAVKTARGEKRASFSDFR